MVQPVYNADFDAGRTGIGSRVRWGAIFAGVVVGLVTQALLTLLGLAIGFQAYNPADPNFQGLGIGSAIWLVLSAVIAAFTGGWAATSLANVVSRMDGMLHGILTWGVLMLVTFWLLGTGLGNIFGGAFNLASSAVTGASQGAAQSGVATVREQVEDITGQISQGREQTGVGAEDVATSVATVAWVAFAASVLSLMASAFGGVSGLKSRNRANMAT